MKLKKQLESLKKVSPLIKTKPKFILSLPKDIFNKIIWRYSRKRRMILQIFSELKPLENTSSQMQKAREDVFKRVALELKLQETMEDLRMLLDACKSPAGPEQIFAAAIFPMILRNNLLFYAQPTEPHRIDLEIGYIGHLDEYYYWMVEVDGINKTGIEQMLEPRRVSKEDVVYIAYRVPAAGILNVEENPDASTLILKSRHILLDIIEDAKRRGYLIAPTKPHTPETRFWQRRKSEHAYQTRLIQHRKRREKYERELRRSR